MTRSLGGRVAVVTGAGRGLGRAEALELAARGAAVLVNDVRDADATAAEIVRRGGRAEADDRDVSTWAGAEGLVGHALEAFGDLHVLVNNAGVVRDGMSFGLSEAAWDAVLDVDLKGHAGPARFAAAYWREQHKAGARAPRRMVNTTSESGLYGSVGQLGVAVHDHYGQSELGMVVANHHHPATTTRAGAAAARRVDGPPLPRPPNGHRRRVRPRDAPPKVDGELACTGSFKRAAGSAPERHYYKK